MLFVRRLFQPTERAARGAKATAAPSLTALLMTSLGGAAYAAQQSGEGEQIAHEPTRIAVRQDDPASVAKGDNSVSESEQSGTSSEDSDVGIALLSFEGNAPYLTWEVGSSQAGSVFELQGPATRSGNSGTNWGTTYSVPDCVAKPCTAPGPDLDPEPGKFLVQQVGSHRIDSTNRYRVTPKTAPAGHAFTSNETREIPGSRATPSANAWVGGLVTIANKQKDDPDLPLTGASGTMLMLVGGIGLVAVAGGTHLVLRRRLEKTA